MSSRFVVKSVQTIDQPQVYKYFTRATEIVDCMLEVAICKVNFIVNDENTNNRNEAHQQIITTNVRHSVFWEIKSNKFFSSFHFRLENRHLPDLDVSQVRRLLQLALNVWARNSKLTFRESSSPDADIQVLFAR